MAQQRLNLQLLIDKGSTGPVTGVQNNVQCDHLHRSYTVSEPTSCFSPLERWDLPDVLCSPPPNFLQQRTYPTNLQTKVEPYMQWTPIKLFIDYLGASISAENVKRYFSRFGEVMEVDLYVEPSTNRPTGRGNITLKPRRNPNEIFQMDHIIRGFRIYVEECFSTNTFEDNSGRKTPVSNCRFLEFHENLEMVARRSPTSTYRSGIRTNQNIPEDQFRFTSQRSASTTKTFQPQRIHLQFHKAVAKSAHVCDFLVEGLTPKITEDHLWNHFAAFGVVFDVLMSTKPSQSAFIAIRPKGDPNEITRTKHIVNGMLFGMTRYFSFGDEIR